MKLELLTNASVVDDAIRFVSSNKFKDRVRSSGDNDEVDKDQLEEEQEEETGEINETTINRVF